MMPDGWKMNIARRKGLKIDLIKRYKEKPLQAKAAFWYMVCFVLQKGILALTTPLFARLMTTEQYGQFTVYMSWSNILIILTTLKLNDSVFNVGMSKFADQRDEVVSTFQILTIALTSALIIFYAVFRDQIQKLIGLADSIILFMIFETYANSAIYFWDKRKYYEYQYKPVVLKTVSMTCLNTLLGLVLVFYMNEKGYGRILSCLLVNGLFGLVILISNLKRGHFTFRPEFAKFALRFNLPLMGHYLSMYILEQFDRIMIQKIAGFSPAALYGLAYHIGTILTILTASIINAITPWMYNKLKQKDYTNIGNTFLKLCFLLCSFSACIAAFAPELILIFGGKEYLDAQYVISPIALCMIFRFLYMLYANIEFFFEKNKAAMFMSGFAAVLDVILNYFGIKLFGYIAAAYTTLICYAVLFALHYAYAMKCFPAGDCEKPDFKIKKTVAILVGTIPVHLSFTLLFSNHIIRYLMILLCLAIISMFRNKFKDVISLVRK